MEFKMFLKKYIKRTLIVTILLILIGNLLIYFNPNNNFERDYGISIYFNMISINRNIIFFVANILLIPSIVLIDYYDYYSNKFYYYIVERVGIKEYNTRALRNIFITSILSNLFINFCLLLSVGIIWSNISFAPQHIFEMFSQNTFINITLYLLLSSVGVGFYAMFLFSIISFIKNKYVFRGFTAILTFATIVFSTFLSPVISAILQLFITDKIFIKTITLSFLPCGLITPGMIYENYGFLNFLCSFVIYTIGFIFCMKLAELLRRKYG